MKHALGDKHITTNVDYGALTKAHQLPHYWLCHWRARLTAKRANFQHEMGPATQPPSTRPPNCPFLAHLTPLYPFSLNAHLICFCFSVLWFRNALRSCPRGVATYDPFFVSWNCYFTFGAEYVVNAGFLRFLLCRGCLLLGVVCKTRRMASSFRGSTVESRNQYGTWFLNTTLNKTLLMRTLLETPNV